MEKHEAWWLVQTQEECIRRDKYEPFDEVYCNCSMLAYGCSADAIDDYVRIGEDTILEVVRRYTKTMIEIFEPKYLRAPNDETPRGCWHWVENKDGLGCLDQLIACTGHGRIIYMVKMSIKRPLQWSNNHFWTLLHRRLSGFGIHSLDCLALITTWMCCRDHRCSLGLLP